MVGFRGLLYTLAKLIRNYNAVKKGRTAIGITHTVASQHRATTVCHQTH